MPDVRAPEEPGTARIIRPGSRMGPKPTGPQIHRTACSEIGAFLTCKQLHGFGYQMGLKSSDEKAARKVGTLVHVGLAYRYGALLPEKPDWMVYPDARTALWTIAQGDVEAGTLALQVFDAYQAHYPIEQNYLKPVLVEHQLEAVMDVDGVPERYTLRIDLLAEDTRDGALVLMDHKTIYKLSRNIGTSYRADREMLTGLGLCNLNGYYPKRVVINAMTKGFQGQQPQFERYDVPISIEALSHIGEDTVHAIRELRAIQVSHPDPARRPRTLESCLRKYGACDFGPICTEGPQRLTEFTKKW